jgi:uncharacterized SAM-binding protein YcdF (DUF218 family)
LTTRWLIWSLVLPSQIIAGTIVAGALLLAIWRGRLATLLVFSGAVLLLLFGFLPTAHRLAYALESRFPVTPLPGDVTGIIVIGGGERVSTSELYGEPQLNAQGSRYLTALRLAARYPQAVLVSTGGPMTEPGRGALGTHSAVAKAILGGVGLDPRRVLYDTRSRDTCDHPGNVRALVNPRPGQTWVVVSSAMHMPRVMACFRAAGWGDVVPYPTDYRIVPGRWSPGTFQVASNLALLDFAAHEWVGLAYYRWTGRTRELFPAPDRIAASAAGRTLESNAVLSAIDPPRVAPYTTRPSEGRLAQR